MTEFDTGLPSVRQVQLLIKEQTEVELKLIGNELLVGKILWQDAHCLCLVGANQQRTLIWRQALAYLKAKN